MAVEVRAPGARAGSPGPMSNPRSITSSSCSRVSTPSATIDWLRRSREVAQRPEHRVRRCPSRRRPGRARGRSSSCRSRPRSGAAGRRSPRPTSSAAVRMPWRRRPRQRLAQPAHVLDRLALGELDDDPARARCRGGGISASSSNGLNASVSSERGDRFTDRYWWPVEVARARDHRLEARQVELDGPASSTRPRRTSRRRSSKPALGQRADEALVAEDGAGPQVVDAAGTRASAAARRRPARPRPRAPRATASRRPCRVACGSNSWMSVRPWRLPQYSAASAWWTSCWRSVAG